MRIGILTGGGDVPGLNPCIKTLVWRAIDDAGVGFWENMSPLPWAFDLIDLVSERFDEAYVCTAPSRHGSCPNGKINWIVKNLPNKWHIHKGRKWCSVF